MLSPVAPATGPAVRHAVVVVIVASQEFGSSCQQIRQRPVINSHAVKHFEDFVAVTAVAKDACAAQSGENKTPACLAGHRRPLTALSDNRRITFLCRLVNPNLVVGCFGLK